MNGIYLKKGDFIKLPNELRSSAKTAFEYGKIENVSDKEDIIEIVLVEEQDVNTSRLHRTLERKGRAFSISMNDIHY